MSVELRPMREEEFAAWCEDARAWYAMDLVENAACDRILPRRRRKQT